MNSSPFLCYNCFHEKPDGGPCPHCGFDLAENEKKFPVALRAGTVLNGRYIVGRVLGQGGFGITYLAWDDKLQARVAVKEFMPNEIATRIGTTVSVAVESRTEDFTYGAERFQEEARTLAKFMGQPNIAGVTDYFDENDTSYFVMDYIEGISFKTYIANQGGKVTVDEALNVMIPVLRALTAVHAEGFIHRDVTPDNIYITKDGMVKLLDFGSARYSIGDKSKSLDVVLKVGYAPKEQYIRRGRQGPYTDVYSCAACFYAALTGYLPPEALERLDKDELLPVSQAGVELPAWLDTAILKGLAVQPEGRFQSAAEFLDAIENQQVVEVPGAAPPQPTAGGQLDAAIAKIKRRPKFFAAIGAAVAAVALALSFLGGGGGDGGGTPLKRSSVPSITIAGETYSTDERKLDLEGKGLTDGDIQDLRYMVNLTWLSLSNNAITDLTPIAGLDGLRNLRLQATGVTDLTPIAGLTNMEYIDLRDNPELTDCSPLAGLTNMTEFNYYNTGVTDISFMQNWTKLEYLELSGLTEGQDLRFLSNMTSLRRIYTNGSGENNYIPSLDFMANMTNLQELDLWGQFETLDLTPLQNLTNLTRLEIGRSGSNGSTSGVTHLEALSNMTKLTQLRLTTDESVTSLAPLAGLTSLKRLELYNYNNANFYSISDLSGLAGMTELTELQITLGDVKDFSPLAGLTKLQRLDLSGNFTANDLSFLSNMTDLRELRLNPYSNSGTNAIQVSDLSALTGLTRLQTLDLRVRNLQSLKGVENMTDLRELTLYGDDSRLADTAPLANLTKLQSLRLPNIDYDAPVQTDLSGLANLTQLQELELNSPAVSLEPLRGLSKLKNLRYYGSNSYRGPSISIAPLSALTGLQELYLYCNITGNDITPLSGLTGLRSLTVNTGSWDDPLRSLEPLRDLTNLTSLSISNTADNIDTSPVAHVASLNIN